MTPSSGSFETGVSTRDKDYNYLSGLTKHYKSTGSARIPKRSPGTELFNLFLPLLLAGH